MKHNKLRILITGGGTGGHVFPAIAIANALRQHLGAENILFVGALGKMEMTKVPQAGYSIVGLPIRGLQGKFTVNNLVLPFKLLSSILKARKILKEFKPDLVIGVGGFASAPVLWMASQLSIPMVIQEQNSVAGKVNRYMGRKATLVFTAFPSAKNQFPAGRTQLTGNPVRRPILDSASLRTAGCAGYGFNPDLPVLLVVGGSQGSHSLNHNMLLHLPEWTSKGIQVIWQTGGSFHPEAERFIISQKLNGVVSTPFIDKMELAYGAADLVISRAGALAISEISIAQLPAIYVPFPFAADDHQRKNAEAMVAEQAALMLTDAELSEKLGRTVSALIFDQKRLYAMRRSAASLACPNADEVIASKILELLGYKQEPVTTQMDQDLFAQTRVVYFLGAGGIGMSGLARWFKLMGKEVHGYDRVSTPLTRALEEEGIVLHYDDRPDLIPANTDLVVFTPAIPADLNERKNLELRGLPMLKRAEVLGKISRNLKTIAVAGTHGKTSTSALITHLLKSAGVAVTAFVGGITRNYHTNFLFTPDSQYLVAEADEFDRSFLHLSPDFSIITSTDADHLDIYDTHEKLLEAFRNFGMLNGVGGPLLVSDKAGAEFGKPLQRYSLNDQDADFAGLNLSEAGVHTQFDLKVHEILHEKITLGIPGRHNVENAVAAAAAALWAGVSIDDIRKGMETFSGVQRRFDIRIHRPDLVYIDDYAHHPSELNACIGAVRKIFPGKSITAIFQPHLFSRTRDFAQGFSDSLSQSDKIILLDIYPAREKPIEGIHSAMLLAMIDNPNKVLLKKEEVVQHLLGNRPEVLLTLGAGDIDTLVPQIEEAFTKTTKS